MNILRRYFYFVKEENDEAWKILLQKKEGFDFKILRYRKYPNYHFFKPFQLRALEKLLRQILSENTIIHLRGAAFSAIVKRITKKSKLNNVKLVTDVRGASYEEILIYSKIKPPLLQLKLYHLKKNLKSLNVNSDYISCVSSKLKDYIIYKTKIDEG